jgi:phage-related holin
MKNYIKFMAWWCSSFDLKDGVTRMFVYVWLAVLGSLLFGHVDHWLIGLLCAIVIELVCSTIAYKYERFKDQQKDNG